MKTVPITTWTHCIKCGGKIEASLAQCGSLTCHDCRRPCR